MVHALIGCAASWGVSTLHLALFKLAWEEEEKERGNRKKMEKESLLLALPSLRKPPHN